MLLLAENVANTGVAQANVIVLPMATAAIFSPRTKTSSS
jgi:hypothetical protein